jgi:methyl-accepting chemotaxis protein
MLEVAHQVRGTTVEQARGHARIQQASGEVRDVAEGMNAAMQEQTAACAEIARVLERVVVRTRESSSEAQTMAEAVRRLADEAERLRQRTRRFEL